MVSSNMTFNNEHFCFHAKSSNFQTFSTAGNGSPKNKLVKWDEFQFHEFFYSPFRLNWTPSAFLVTGWIIILVTVECIAMCKFFLCRMGLKKALEVLHLDPLRMVPCGIIKPVWNSPFPSRFSNPISTPALKFQRV